MLTDTLTKAKKIKRFWSLRHTVPKEIDFLRYNMKCSGENKILRGIFHVHSISLSSTFRFFYKFFDSVASAPAVTVSVYFTDILIIFGTVCLGAPSRPAWVCIWQLVGGRSAWKSHFPPGWWRSPRAAPSSPPARGKESNHSSRRIHHRRSMKTEAQAKVVAVVWRMTLNAAPII